MTQHTIAFDEEQLNERQAAVDAPQLKAATTTTKSTIGLLVNDRPGVLRAYCTGFFHGEGYNIENLVVSQAHIPNTSRMTTTCIGPRASLQRIILQLNKLVDVIHANDHTDDKQSYRLTLFKIGCTVSERAEVLANHRSIPWQDRRYLV